MMMLMKKVTLLLVLLTSLFSIIFAQEQIGSWQDKDFTTEWQEKEWDFSSFFGARGKYTITFTYTKGAHMLQMKDAVILTDDVPVFESPDEVSAGYNPRSFSFEFCLISKPEKLILQGNTRTDGGRNSYGNITLSFEDEMVANGVLYISEKSVQTENPEQSLATKYKQYSERQDFSYIEFPEGITEIGYSSFSGTSLKKVVVPGTVKLIDGWAFAHCQDLEEVIIEDGVEEIREGAFYDCPALVSVTLPASVVSIPKANALFGENKETRVFYCPEGSLAYEKAVQNGFQAVDSQ